MADSLTDTVISWLKGSPAQATVPPQPSFTPAPPLPWYPTAQTAEDAKNVGFGYGSGNESFLNDETARLTGTKLGKNFIPTALAGDAMGLSNAAGNENYSHNVDMNSASLDPKIRDKMQDVYMRAALAANRNPIAALGFDPHRVVVDPLVDTKTAKIPFNGAYNQTTDYTYSNLSAPEPSNMVHEATHRGLTMLQQQNPLIMQRLLGKFPELGGSDQEAIVRYLMAKTAGDPEENREQRNFAVNTISGDPDRQTALQNIQLLAQEAIKNRSQGHAH